MNRNSRYCIKSHTKEQQNRLSCTCLNPPNVPVPQCYDVNVAIQRFHLQVEYLTALDQSWEVRLPWCYHVVCRARNIWYFFTRSHKKHIAALFILNDWYNFLILFLFKQHFCFETNICFAWSIWIAKVYKRCALSMLNSLDVGIHNVCSLCGTCSEAHNILYWWSPWWKVNRGSSRCVENRRLPSFCRTASYLHQPSSYSTPFLQKRRAGKQFTSLVDLPLCRLESKPLLLTQHLNHHWQLQQPVCLMPQDNHRKRMCLQQLEHQLQLIHHPAKSQVPNVKKPCIYMLVLLSRIAYAVRFWPALIAHFVLFYDVLCVCCTLGSCCSTQICWDVIRSTSKSRMLMMCSCIAVTFELHFRWNKCFLSCIHIRNCQYFQTYGWPCRLHLCSSPFRDKKQISQSKTNVSSCCNRFPQVYHQHPHEY